MKDLIAYRDTWDIIVHVHNLRSHYALYLYFFKIHHYKRVEQIVNLY